MPCQFDSSRNNILPLSLNLSVFKFSGIAYLMIIRLDNYNDSIVQRSLHLNGSINCKNGDYYIKNAKFRFMKKGTGSHSRVK